MIDAKIMATRNLWYYRDQLLRIIEESLEVSLVICNAEFDEFTVAKIFDIFNQVLPTGFVLSTGYWPFFNSIKKQSICICGRYGINCRHYRQDYHWIDLENVNNDYTKRFSTKIGTYGLLNSDIEVTPITDSVAGYTVNIKLVLQHQKIERGRPRRRKIDNLDSSLEEVMICSRFVLRREYYPALHSVMFQPSPFFYKSYGTYFQKLLHTRQSLTHHPIEMNPEFYTVPVEYMHHFTLLLQCANVPVHQYLKTISHTPLASTSSAHTPLAASFSSKPKNVTHNKSTQTEARDNSEVWRYKELIGGLKPLWDDSKSSSRESIFAKPADIREDKKENIAVSSIAESLKSLIEDVDEEPSPVEDHDEYPTSTTHEKDYDEQWPQWGYQKTVTSKSGRKRPQGNSFFGYNVDDISNRFNFKYKSPRLNTEICNQMPSYAAAVRCLRPGELNCQNDSQTRIRSGIHQEYHVLDSEFPCLPIAKPSIQKVNLEEQFDIAEEFISQEKERERNQVITRL